jgi:hypothetical protein
MKVHELIAMLEDCDPNADVWVMSQPNYPYAERRLMRSGNRSARDLDDGPRVEMKYP